MVIKMSHAVLILFILPRCHGVSRPWSEWKLLKYKLAEFETKHFFFVEYIYTFEITRPSVSEIRRFHGQSWYLGFKTSFRRAAAREGQLWGNFCAVLQPGIASICCVGHSTKMISCGICCWSVSNKSVYQDSVIRPRVPRSLVFIAVS